jgi:polyhydroxybutyrate depolymerase
MSNGAIMSYSLACETGIFAAIGPVSGTQLDPCRSSHPTSVMHIHGTTDRLIPYHGGQGAGVAHISGPSAPEVNAFWRNVDHCGAAATTTSGSIATSTAGCAGQPQRGADHRRRQRSPVAQLRHPEAVAVLRRTSPLSITPLVRL